MFLPKNSIVHKSFYNQAQHRESSAIDWGSRETRFFNTIYIVIRFLRIQMKKIRRETTQYSK